MNSATSQATSTDICPPRATGEGPSIRQFRVLFCCWSELNVASGTPVIVCDVLKHFAPTEAEVFVEKNIDQKRRRETAIEQPVYKYRFHTILWPFSRGHRIRNRLARLGLPVLVAQLVRRIRRFRPDCIYAVYAQPHWILATWIASRLTRVPVIYHVHDAFLEASARRRESRFSNWLERKTLTSARVLALDDHMAEHYQQRYGIRCTILRHIVGHSPLPPKTKSSTDVAALTDGRPPARVPRTIVIGFSGAIYDSNAHQLAELCRLVEADPSMHLKIWTGSAAELPALGIRGARVEVAFEANYERLLANLASCDLLYLPLQFADGTRLGAQAMEFSLPTKSFDYVLSGVPILVHCPAGFSLSRFFEQGGCGHVLNDPRTEAVRQWLDAWRAGQIPDLAEAARTKTLAMYTAEENQRTLWEVLGEEADRARRAKARDHSRSS
jgi:hypothetical protein